MSKEKKRQRTVDSLKNRDCTIIRAWLTLPITLASIYFSTCCWFGFNSKCVVGFVSGQGRPCLSSRMYKWTLWPPGPSLLSHSLSKSIHSKFTPSSTDTTPVCWGIQGHQRGAQGLDRDVVYLHGCGCEDPSAIHGDGRRLPGHWETWQGRKENFPINLGNWYKLCCDSIQSAFLF